MTCTALPLAVIFGGSRGIGKACVHEFLQKGWRIVAVGRNPDNLQSLQAQTMSANLICHVCDVADEAQVTDTVKRLETSVGPILAVVNSAGISMNKLLMQSSSEEIHSIFNTNIIGTINATRAAVRYMIKRNRGSITNIGSVVGLRGNHGQSVYCASKAAIVGFTRSLAKEVASRNIRVNMVSPGFIVTDMTAQLRALSIVEKIPLGRIGRPEEVAKVIEFLASKGTYITGQDILVDGGLAMRL